MKQRFVSTILSARFWGLWILPALVIAWLIRTDPDPDMGSTRDMLQGFVVGILAVTAAHLARKFVLHYIKLEDFVRRARDGNTAAAIVVFGVLIFMSALLFVFAPRAHAEDVRTFVPKSAYVYTPVLKAEQHRLWPDHPAPAFLGALVEQESCITLHHPRCWNPAARLKTDREEGAGLGQITRAYRKDGSVRMDALAAVRQLDPSLQEWSWSNVYSRPDLQLRAIVVMNRDCGRRMLRLVKDPIEALTMCDAAYNGGYAGVQEERRACGQRAGCDPQRWFQNVELVCLKAKTAWKGYSKSACQINREHVQMVAVVRRPKYVPLLEVI